MNTIIIAFDPATITGYAVLEMKPEIQIAGIGIIKVSKPLGAGLMEYSDTIRGLFRLWKPTFVVCEKLYLFRRRTIQLLGELIATIRLEAYRYNACELSFFTATEARKRIGVGGGADKKKVAQFLQERFENDSDVDWNNDNITDAIAIAWAMAMEIKNKGGS